MLLRLLLLVMVLLCVNQAQHREWEAAEAHKKALVREVALKLKADRAAQLADRDLVRCVCLCVRASSDEVLTRNNTVCRSTCITKQQSHL